MRTEPPFVLLTSLTQHLLAIAARMALQRSACHYSALRGSIHPAQ